MFKLDNKETELLRDAANNHLYLRFFDVVWNRQEHQALPDGVLTVKTPLQGLSVTPVIYITNQSLQQSSLTEMDSLAFKVNRLADRLAKEHHLAYTNIQIDCDWSVATKTKYFAFLRAFKRYNRKPLEATIRLHQVKYPERTGVPPVDKGLLMFYNMGKISADLNAGNSIYNEKDAAAYIAALPHYQLPLDVALPLFSWAVQIRDGKVAQVYAKITVQDLSNPGNFEVLPAGGGAEPAYRSLKSFYLKGVYVKKGDLFKFEGMNAGKLTQAAKQVAQYLPLLKNRNIIYYELSSASLSSLYAKDIKGVSAHF
ncbi:MAG: hypothetical protein ABWY16_04870 [Pedobacter sp.]|uniref:hypothetical protein n=1 Tax=Pedobacter sp. TaxID=1411316 RepID=UPI003397ED47